MNRQRDGWLWVKINARSRKEIYKYRLTFARFVVYCRAAGSEVTEGANETPL